MPLDPQLKTSIRNALHGIRVTGLSQMVACDLYELFILTIVIDAAKSQGPVSIAHFDMSGNVSSSVRCPTSPRALGRGDYTHVRIAYPGKKTLEVHLGIYVLGKSTIKHECDVVVLLHEEAENCRQRTINPPPGPVFHPKASSVLCYAECKCYFKTHLDIGHGRAFMGLWQDIKPTAVCACFVTTKTHDAINKYLQTHKKFCAENFKPGNTGEIDWLKSKIADRFRSFKQTR